MEYPTSPLVFSQSTHKPSGECVYQESTSDKWDIHGNTMRKCCMTILPPCQLRSQNSAMNEIAQWEGWV